VCECESMHVSDGEDCVICVALKAQSEKWYAKVSKFVVLKSDLVKNVGLWYCTNFLVLKQESTSLLLVLPN
jgi:hypothetical protein